MYNLTDLEYFHYVDEAAYRNGGTYLPALCGRVLERAPLQSRHNTTAPLCPHCRQAFLASRKEQAMLLDRVRAEMPARLGTFAGV